MVQIFLNDVQFKDQNYMREEKEVSFSMTEIFGDVPTQHRVGQPIYTAMRQKLNIILNTLHTEIEESKKHFQSIKSELQSKVKEKDDIIGCLVKINSELVYENQQLKKTNFRSLEHYQKVYSQAKTNLEKEKQSMISVIKYLETRNEQLVQGMHKHYLSHEKNHQKFLQIKGFSPYRSYGEDWKQMLKINKKTDFDSTQISNGHSAKWSQFEKTQTLKELQRTQKKNQLKSYSRNNFHSIKVPTKKKTTV